MQLRAHSRNDRVLLCPEVSNKGFRVLMPGRLPAGIMLMLCVLFVKTGHCDAQQDSAPETSVRHSTLDSESVEPSADSATTQTKATGEATQSDSSSSEAESDDEGTERDERRLRVGTAGMILLGLIGILGVFGLAFSIIWGGRLRRIVRQDRAEETTYDPLWYLKGKKSRGIWEDRSEDVPGPDDEPTATGDES